MFADGGRTYRQFLRDQDAAYAILDQVAVNLRWKVCRWQTQPLQDLKAALTGNGAKEGINFHVDSRSADRLARCRPAASKFAGSSHRSNATFTSCHSLSMIEYQAVSRFRPLEMMACRNM